MFILYMFTCKVFVYMYVCGYVYAYLSLYIEAELLSNSPFLRGRTSYNQHCSHAMYSEMSLMKKHCSRGLIDAFVRQRCFVHVALSVFARALRRRLYNVKQPDTAWPVIAQRVTPANKNVTDRYI